MSFLKKIVTICDNFKINVSNPSLACSNRLAQEIVFFANTSILRPIGSNFIKTCRLLEAPTIGVTHLIKDEISE